MQSCSCGFFWASFPPINGHPPLGASCSSFLFIKGHWVALLFYPIMDGWPIGIWSFTAILSYSGLTSCVFLKRFFKNITIECIIDNDKIQDVYYNWI